MTQKIALGIDVGSTTVKAVVVDQENNEILWQDYQRHETKQAEKVVDFLVRIGHEFNSISPENIKVFITGSGGGVLADYLGAKFVQEVNAVTIAAEKMYPDIGSVIELGGQDAKIIIFKENETTGEKLSITSMNDKCASGTGATIDKCMLKVGMKPEEVQLLSFDDSKLHHVAAKCGVFAETDIVNLVKTGIPAPEIMCSLADAIVMQNLSVLTRGNTLRSKVILLGGPNCYLPFLQECWRKRIVETWEERGYEFDKEAPIEELIEIPKDSLYFAAYGAVLFGLADDSFADHYQGLTKLQNYIRHGRGQKLQELSDIPLVKSEEELEAFISEYTIPKFENYKPSPGEIVSGYLGVDGGSTSSKCVLVDIDGNILLKEYQLSKGNPIQDLKEMLGRMNQKVDDQGASLKILGFGCTGYAGQVLNQALNGDSNVVETVSHMRSAMHFFDDVDVICDIGGQDIKVLMIKNRELKNFKLSNQCSAGNGMLLQAMADQFGIPVTEYAENAFRANHAPKFNYGCAVFLDSDRVNFQKEGFGKEELMAGLAMVLPKNVWQYVVQIPRLAELGRTFVLQGGTQYNQAALKAQVDYIKERVPNGKVYVHPHPGEAGAFGVALEAKRVVEKRGFSTFVGLENAIDITYTTKNDEETRCYFCPNHCSRTFVDTVTPSGETARYISGFSCEKGTVESKESLMLLQKERAKRLRRYPNLVTYEAKNVFKYSYPFQPIPEASEEIDDVQVKKTFWGQIKTLPIKRKIERSNTLMEKGRESIVIAMPKVLNMWTMGPFFRTYFEVLGIKPSNLIFSDDSGEEMFAEGGKYGSIDSCYPSKVAQAHIHNILFKKNSERKPINYLYFPIMTHMETYLENVMGNATCPIVAGTPEVIKAAFTKEVDFFARSGVEYCCDDLNFGELLLLKDQMFKAWEYRLGITEDESNWAVEQGLKAMQAFDFIMESKGKEILEKVSENNEMCLLMVGRPYHLDPGLNHEIMEEFQAEGYPVLSVRSLPKDKEFITGLFEEDENPFDINDVWPENFSVNSAQKVWAVKYAARHPNIALVDFSSFKCGHDAPTYGIIDNIVSYANTGFSAFHDVDANKPGGSIKIRVSTYSYSLKIREEELRSKNETIEMKLPSNNQGKEDARVSYQ